MGARRIRREQRQVDMATSRIDNGHKKKKERVRRDSRMLELVKANKLPYTPTILSWLSVQLRRIDALVDPDTIEDTQAAQADWERAAAAWRTLAPGVDVEEALAVRAEIEAMAGPRVVVVLEESVDEPQMLPRSDVARA